MMPDKNTILDLIGPQPYTEMMLVDNQDTKDIIEAILSKHEKTEGDYDKFAFLFDGGSVPDIAKRLFDFCKKNLAYVVEKTKAQYTTKPATMLRRGYADCKGYAMFCGGVLDALKRQGEKIDWAFRFASYNVFKKKPYHVFIVIKYQGQELFLDPVFNTFNFHKPAMWAYDYYWSDQQTAAIAGMGVGCSGSLHALSDGDSVGYDNDSIGSTASGTGSAIISVTSKLAVVPVVGWIAGAAGAIVGGVIGVLGSKWNQSPDVRWLQQLYDYYAKGMANVTSDNKVSNSEPSQEAQAFFTVVLGVPIGGRKDFNILQSGDGNTNTPNGHTAAQRAADYLNWKGLTGKIPLEDAINAANIAATLNPQQFKAGGWAGLTASPWVVQKDAQGNYSATLTQPATGSGSNTQLSSLFANKWVLIAIVGAGIMVLYEANKKPKRNGQRS